MAETSRQPQAGAKNQRVVSVGFGAIANHRYDRGFQATGEFRGDGNRLAVIGFNRHVVKPGRCGRRCGAGRDLIGALVDDAQSVIFDHRDPIGQRQGHATRKDLEAETRRVIIAVDTVDRKRHGTSGGELFDGGDISNRL
jgi:hypothetical protein